MWTKEFASKLGRLVVRGLVRWLEMLGENPPLSRDHGFLVWQALHERRDQWGGQARHEQEVRPVGQPGRAGGPAPHGWIPPLGPVAQSGPLHPTI